MIRCYCPTCHAHLEVQDTFAGQKCPCPQCGQRLQVPSPAPALNQTILADLLTPSRTPTLLGEYLPPKRTADSGERVRLSCPSCQRSLKMKRSRMGKRGRCPKCGCIMKFPATAPTTSKLSVPSENYPRQGRWPRAGCLLGMLVLLVEIVAVFLIVVLLARKPGLQEQQAKVNQAVNEGKEAAEWKLQPQQVEEVKPKPQQTEKRNQPRAEPESITPNNIAQQLLKLHNKEREIKGRPPLSLNHQLNDYAQKHADWMAQHNKLQHSDIKDLQHIPNLQLVTVGENIAWRQQNPLEVTNAWMHSSGHQANILNWFFTQVGFGVAYDHKGEPYWCTVFGG